MSQSNQIVMQLARAYHESAPRLDDTTRVITLCLYQLLSAGSPVPEEKISDETGIDSSEVSRFLSSWSGVFYDDHGGVTGFRGLSIEPMNHRLDIGDNSLYTWCAWDGLFIPQLLRVPAILVTQCPVSNTRISVHLDNNGRFEARSNEFVMSFMQPRQGMFDQNIIGQFCQYVNFFKDRQTALPWSESNPGTVLLDLAQAAELARIKNEMQFGSLLQDDRGKQGLVS